MNKKDRLYKTMYRVIYYFVIFMFLCLFALKTVPVINMFLLNKGLSNLITDLIIFVICFGIVRFILFIDVRIKMLIQKF